MKSSNNLLGRFYPFFLNNSDLKDSHYLYQVYSPGLVRDLIPGVSLTKVSEGTSEKTKDLPTGSDLDIISVCIGDKATEDIALKYCTGMTRVKKDDENKVIVVKGAKEHLPVIEISEDSNLPQKALVLGLRDALRWKNYRFAPGRFIDILWTPTEFVVFEICGDKTHTWLESRAAYKTIDTGLKNPLDIDITTIKINEKWERSKNIASEINHATKVLEWNSFTRQALV